MTAREIEEVNRETRRRFYQAALADVAKGHSRMRDDVAIWGFALKKSAQTIRRDLLRADAALRRKKQ